MEPLFIDPTEETPQVHFDASRGYFRISGKSYPEDLIKFYNPLLEYLQDYVKAPQTFTRFEFSWMYYNTATSKLLVRILVLLREHCPELIIKWVCRKDYDLMIEKGEELKELLGINLVISEE